MGESFQKRVKRKGNRMIIMKLWTLMVAFGLLSVAAEAQHIGLETNFNQKTVVGIGGNSGTHVYFDGHLRSKGETVRFLVGDPPQYTDRLVFIPQTLTDGRTPAVVTTRELAGVRYECTAFESILPEVGRTLVLGLKAVNTTAKPLKARWAVELPPEKTADPIEKPAVTAWCDKSGRRAITENPWALLSPNAYSQNDGSATVPAALRNTRIGRSGEPIRYAIRVRPNGRYSIAVAFYEYILKEKGRRLMDVDIEGRTVAKDVDIIAQGNASRCLVIAADAPKPSKDGLLHVMIRPSANAIDKAATISAIWLFENMPAEKIDCAGLAAGQPPVKPSVAINCGDELYESLTGEQYIYEWPLGPGESREGQVSPALCGGIFQSTGRQHAPDERIAQSHGELVGILADARNVRPPAGPRSGGPLLCFPIVSADHARADRRLFSGDARTAGLLQVLVSRWLLPHAGV